MKLSPEKKSQKKDSSIPTIEEYKKGNYSKGMFMATAFSLGLALTPLMITGCNSGTPGNLKPKTQQVNVKPSRVMGRMIENKVEKPETTLGDAIPCDSGKVFDTKKPNKIKKPDLIDGMVGSIKHIEKKDPKKVDKLIRRPLKLKGKRLAPPKK